MSDKELDTFAKSAKAGITMIFILLAGLHWLQPML